MTITELACPGCGAPVSLSEKETYKAGKLIYYCRPCLTRYGLVPPGGAGAAPRPPAPPEDVGQKTVRLRVQTGGPKRKISPLTELVQPSAREPLPAGVCLSLEVVSGPERSRSVKVEWTRTILGRDVADIRFEDPGVSRKHAMLEVYDGETIVLKDLASTNGTYHNGGLIDHCKLEDGDEIRIGSTLLSVTLDAAR